MVKKLNDKRREKEDDEGVPKVCSRCAQGVPKSNCKIQRKKRE